MTNKPGRGRPTKYTTKMPGCLTNYTKKCQKEGIFPTIEGLAIKLRVAVRTLYDWEQAYPDFLHTMEQLRNVQKQLLITNGLTGGYNTRFSMFLLKSNHGMTENEPAINATQNNTYDNVSKELIADALEIMASRAGQ